MTDSERLAEIRADFANDPGHDANFLLNLLDTEREKGAGLEIYIKVRVEQLEGLLQQAVSERDAALARVGELVDAAQNLKRFTYHSNGPDGPKSLAHQRLWDALAALTPPAYPPEQPL